MGINESLGINSSVSPLAKAYLKGNQADDPPSQKSSLQYDKGPSNLIHRDSVAISLNGPTRKTFLSVQGVNSEMNHVAKSVRESNSILETAVGYLRGMKAALTKIVKNFPPFPHDSAERADLLMSYRSLRKEIEKMTFPPSFATILNATPDLPIGATDGQIHDALKSVESAGEQFDTA